MRVLQVVHALPPDNYGGTELYTKSLAEVLADDHDVAVATPYGAGATIDGGAVFDLEEPDVDADADQSVSPTSSVRNSDVEDSLRDVLDEFDPDVVHLQHFKFLSAGIPALCRDRGIPCVATLHDFFAICHQEQLFKPDGTRCSGPESVAKCTDCCVDALADDSLLDRLRRPVRRRRYASTVERRSDQLATALDAADRLVAPSRFLRQTFVEFGVDPEQIVHRRNGIRTEGFQDSGFNPSTPVRIGYAGRLASVKGIHLLLHAFRRLDAPAELHVFGSFDPDRPYHARLQELADDRVTFHGWYEDVATPYATMDVFVLPSVWYENSPIVIQEAFASGVPVVTADVGGMAELVTHGVDGLTFRAGDVDGLHAALERVAASPSLVEQLRDGVQEPKRLDDHAADIATVYRDCMAAQTTDASV